MKTFAAIYAIIGTLSFISIIVSVFGLLWCDWSDVWVVVFWAKMWLSSLITYLILLALDHDDRITGCLKK